MSSLYSARLANATQPAFLSPLVVRFPQGKARFHAGFPEWQPLDQACLFREVERLLSQRELRRTVFRSDHASHWLVLKGTLEASAVAPPLFCGVACIRPHKDSAPGGVHR